VELLRPDIVAVREGDRLRLRSGVALEPPPSRLADLLLQGARSHPERLLFVERVQSGHLVRRTWGEVGERCRGIAAWLLERGERGPVAILSGNSIPHAELALACAIAAIPIAPISVGYSLKSKDHAQLKDVVRQLRPTAVFVEPVEMFGPAMAASGLDAVVRYSADELERAAATRAGPEVDAVLAASGPDTVVKILFTSGSTGRPKGVPTTQGMLCANQQMIAQCWPYLRASPPVLVDWLPWSHTFGGSHNLNLVLFHGGTLVIDEGRPIPGLFERTAAHLRETPPTDYFTVPAGYAALVPKLEDDAGLAEAFFSRLRTLFYAGAALPDDLWQRLSRLAEAARVDVFLTTAWGSTETSPLSTSAHFRLERAGNVGVPAPGVEILLVPSGSKREVRIAGPHVFGGYLDGAADAFDDDGFYRIGDAMRLADPDDPSAGLVFDGRVAENFKLTSGTWVSVGTLRTAILEACSPALSDLVLCGHDRDAIGILAWPSPAGVARLGDRLRDHVSAALARFNDGGRGSASRVRRALLLAEPPQPDAGEITDKGYVNQRAVLDRRHGDVERLFSDPADPAVIVVGD
jgi:feruloyl-CoA synthase